MATAVQRTQGYNTFAPAQQQQQQQQRPAYASAQQQQQAWAAQAQANGMTPQQMQQVNADVRAQQTRYASAPNGAMAPSAYPFEGGYEGGSYDLLPPIEGGDGGDGDVYQEPLQQEPTGEAEMPPELTPEDVEAMQAQEIQEKEADAAHPHHCVDLMGMVRLPQSSNDADFAALLSGEHKNTIRLTIANGLLQPSVLTDKDIVAKLQDPNAEFFVSSVEIMPGSSNHTAQCVELVVDGTAATSSNKSIVMLPHSVKTDRHTLLEAAFSARTKQFVQESGVSRVEHIKAHAKVDGDVVTYTFSGDAANKGSYVADRYRELFGKSPFFVNANAIVMSRDEYDAILRYFEEWAAGNSMPTRSSEFGVSIHRHVFREAGLAPGVARWVSADITTDKAPIIAFVVRVYIAH